MLINDGEMEKGTEIINNFIETYFYMGGSILNMKTCKGFIFKEGIPPVKFLAKL
jgi:hypothetical protein